MCGTWPDPPGRRTVGGHVQKNGGVATSRSGLEICIASGGPTAVVPLRPRGVPRSTHERRSWDIRIGTEADIMKTSFKCDYNEHQRSVEV